VLADRDAAMDRWLREEILPAYDEYLADPSRAIPMDQAFAEARAAYVARKDKGD
jgi:antitoxin ParD1/3/4